MKHAPLCPFMSLSIEENRLKTFGAWNANLSIYSPAQVTYIIITYITVV